MKTLDMAANLMNDVHSALVAAALEDTIVTLDPVEASAAVESGASVVLLDPPQVTFETYHEVTGVFTLNLIAGHTEEHRIAAWAELDALVVALRVPTDLDELAPGTFTAAQGSTHPAFIAKTTQPYTL